jgi:hypothetical protein
MLSESVCVIVGDYGLLASVASAANERPVKRNEGSRALPEDD